MGFWKGVAGGLVGLATGGPVGAAAGSLSGLASNGGDSATQTSSQTSTRSVDLRGLSPQEQAMYDQGVSGVLAQDMTPDEAARLREQTYGDIYGLQSDSINRSADAASSRAYASDARRGAAGGSAGQSRDILRQGETERALGEASRTASLSANDAVLQEQANRRANAQAYMNRINSIWSNQLASSNVTTTGNSTGTYTGKDTFWEDAAGGIGVALGSKDSWVNDLFEKKPGIDASATPLIGGPSSGNTNDTLAILGPQQSRQMS